MSDLKKYLKKQLEDPEFREYYEEMMPVAEISRAIVGARLEQGLTQKELAQKVGVSQGDISRLESCEGNPSLKMLMRVAKGLNMRLSISFMPTSK